MVKGLERVAFRVDASLDIGTGHVHRCLTLAEALRERGAACHFICRNHNGNMADHIRARDFELHLFNAKNPGFDFEETSNELLPAHIEWLGSDWCEDAEQTIHLLKQLNPDWLIVDHYALDYRWEEIQRHCVRQIMVIDDLADRHHDCDLLLDQNLGRLPDDYFKLLSIDSVLLLGPEFALLRSEFAALRDSTLRRREEGIVKSLLVSMGGIDANNVTGQVLNVLETVSLPEGCAITVLLGSNAPWLNTVRSLVSKSKQIVELIVDCPSVAQVMSAADIAIGAAGTSSWERCCLGLPTLLVELAENQRGIANNLEAAGVARLIPLGDMMARRLTSELQILLDDSGVLRKMSKAAARITEGAGADIVADAIAEYSFRQGSSNAEVRPMLETDLELVRGWRNHPDVRNFMYTRHDISRNEHAEWFRKSSRDSNRLLLIFELDSVPTGFASFDLGDNGSAAWGFYCAPGAKKGTGTELGNAALRYIFKKCNVAEVKGEALSFNKASIGLHRKLGFVELSKREVTNAEGKEVGEVIAFRLAREDWQARNNV